MGAETSHLGILPDTHSEYHHMVLHLKVESIILEGYSRIEMNSNSLKHQLGFLC